MLTRLRVQGFKNLLDVDIRFGPFTCIAGKNGSGKSNIFDAIRFLSLLAQHPIREAVQKLRDTEDRSFRPEGLFTALQGHVASEIRIIAELLIDRHAVDEFGEKSQASKSTVEYGLSLRLTDDDGTKRIVLAEEWLRPITQGAARHNLGFHTVPKFVESAISGRRPKPYISTETGENPIVRIHQEGHGGRRLPAPKWSRTALGGHASSDFPTILAVQKEMVGWQTLMLEPSSMRAPSRYQDDSEIDAHGANLPATIQRLIKTEAQKDQICTELANRLGDLLDDVQALRIRDDQTTETLTLEVCGHDEVYHPAQSLSDGALRFLVLSVLALDSKKRGVLCLEEPENGVHPDRIEAMIELLRDIAIDPGYAVDDENPLRQVVINTHSPEVMELLDVDDLIYVEEKRIVSATRGGYVASILVPEGSWRSRMDGAPGLLRQTQARPYLRIPNNSRQGQFADIYGKAWEGVR